MKRALLPLFLVVAVSLLALLLPGTPSPGSTEALRTPVGTAGCIEATLLQRPGWTTSGAWTPDGNDLILADAQNHALLRYSSNGRPLGALTGTFGAALSNLSPSVLRSNDLTQERLVEVQDGGANRLLSMDRNLVPIRIREVESASFNSSKERISGLFQWQPVGQDLVTFSDIQGPRENDWSSGIVRFAPDDPVHFTLLRSIANLDDPERTFYRLGFPYITSVGNTAYILTMGTTPGIFKDTAPDGSKAQSLWRVRDPLAAGLNAELNPDLPSLRTKQDFVAVMSVVEHSAMPTGIFGWEQQLYVLSRSPMDGATSWKLSRFDLSGEPVAEMRIPSSAANLTVVPGPKTWAFVEKGPVLDYGKQEVRSILFVPSSLIQEKLPSSSAAGTPSVCRDDV